MVRRNFTILGLVVLLILLVGAGPASAHGKLPTWTSVFPTDLLPEIPGTSDYPGGHILWSMESFNNQLFAAFSSLGNGLTVYRSFDGITWENVTPPGLKENYLISWDMQVFENHLYLEANDYWPGAHPGAVLRTANGKDWETVFEGTPDSMAGNQADKLGVYNGMIYLTAIGPTGQVWRSRTGNSGKWELVTASLGQDVYGTASPVSFNGDLFMSGSSSGTVKVWRSHNGKTWEVMGAGILDVPNNSAENGNLTVFNHQLYLSVSNDVDGGRLYRSGDGKHWKLAVNQDFVAHNITEVTTIVYNNDLYAIANDNITPDCYSYCAKIMRSHSGKPGDWELLTDEMGWGPLSGTVRNTQAIFNGKLYVANFLAFYDGIGNLNAIYRMDR